VTDTASLLHRFASGELSTLRLAFADQHGVLRGKSVTASEVPRALEKGVGFTTTLFLKDTAHRTVFPAFTPGGGVGVPEFSGAADAVMRPDVSTFRELPWLQATGWVLCDTHFADGRRVPFDCRDVLRRAVAALAERGLKLRCGLEVEFSLFRLLDPKLAPEDAGQPGTPPQVALLTQGYQYLTEQRLDQLEPAIAPIQSALLALGLPLASIECEYGPSQVELTFGVQDAMEAADTMVLLRSAVKQVAARHGLHASFMCRPRTPNAMSSGWHFHHSLADASGNAFAAPDRMLSPSGEAWLAGLLAHAPALSLFACPTVNGYRRFRPNSLAPDRAVWARDNRGVMCRVLGGFGDPATRIENRIGEPAANPYLYIAAQIFCGLDGLARGLVPPPPAETPYETGAPLLPRSLDAALEALAADTVLRDAVGPRFCDWYSHIKRAELARFHAEVTDWEQREYFGLF
jgi:glutamine synthetase